MKNAIGYVRRYGGSRTWSAELHSGNAFFETYGHKRMKDAVVAANKIAKLLKWKLIEPWNLL